MRILAMKKLQEAKQWEEHSGGDTLENGRFVNQKCATAIDDHSDICGTIII